MSTPPREPTEDEIRAAYEQELKRLRVEDVILQTLVSLINLGGRKAGLARGTEDERDLGQLRMAIEGARALLPLVEPELGQDAAQVRQALSQLQMAYAQQAGGEQPPEPAAQQPQPEPQQPQQPGAEGPGPAQRSGRLWIPGQ